LEHVEHCFTKIYAKREGLFYVWRILCSCVRAEVTLNVIPVSTVWSGKWRYKCVPLEQMSRVW